MDEAHMGFVHNFWQLTVDGLSTGSLYAVIALGYTLVYGVLQLINFAHSEVFMLGGFGGLFAVRGVAPNGAHRLAVGRPDRVGLLCGARRRWPRGLRPRAHRLCAAAPSRGSEAGLSDQRDRGVLFTFNLAGKEFGRQNVNVPPLYSDSRVLFHVFSAKVQIKTVLIFGVAILMLVFAGPAGQRNPARQGHPRGRAGL